MLMATTPYYGDYDRFGHFLRLIDPELFPEPHILGNRAIELRKDILTLGRDCPWALRRMKEELRDLDGRRLFTDRHSLTVTFALTSEDYVPYNAITHHINQFLPKVTSHPNQAS